MPQYGFLDTIFLRRVYFFVGNRKEFLAWLAASFGKGATKDIPKDACGLSGYVMAPALHCKGLKSRVCYIWLWCFCDNALDKGTLAHEAFHVATMIMEDLGVDTTDADGAEPVAYYTDALVRQFMEQQKGV